MPSNFPQELTDLIIDNLDTTSLTSGGYVSKSWRTRTRYCLFSCLWADADELCILPGLAEVLKETPSYQLVHPEKLALYHYQNEDDPGSLLEIVEQLISIGIDFDQCKTISLSSCAVEAVAALFGHFPALKYIQLNDIRSLIPDTDFPLPPLNPLPRIEKITYYAPEDQWSNDLRFIPWLLTPGLQHLVINDERYHEDRVDIDRLSTELRKLNLTLQYFELHISAFELDTGG